MSKLQKALQKLRSSEVPIPPGRHRHSGGEARSGTDREVPPESALGRLNSRRDEYLTEETSIREKLPEPEISISLEMLSDQGYQPNREDLELVAQQFRRIKRPILQVAFRAGSAAGENANVIMIASALPKTGKTFCSFSLAVSIARERDVGSVLVDADVLKPNISRVLGLDERIGLIDYLLDPALTIDDILVPTETYGIVVVPAGQQHEEATELLASRRMKQFIENTSERFRSRAIIVDTPPLLLTNEAHVLAELMGQIVLVIDAGISTQESVVEVLSTLNRAKPINAILNKARSKSVEGYSGDGYGYYGAPQGGRRYANRKEE